VEIEVFLRRICASLEHHEIPYMVTGSVASSIHGIPRSTNDLDIVIAPTPDQLRAFIDFVKRFGYFAQWEAAENALRARDQFNVIDFPNAWKADLIIQKARDFSATEFERREQIEVGDLRFVVARPEDVLIAKLEWTKISPSERQMQDAAGILIVQGDQLDLSYVEKWVNALELQEQWQAVRELANY
jgi:hypothetical protein